MARIKLDRRGVEAMLKSRGVRKMLHEKGERVAAQARSIAPVESGEYRDGIVVTDDETDRAVCRIGSTVDYALAVEAATGTMSRALDAAGG